MKMIFKKYCDEQTGNQARTKHTLRFGPDNKMAPPPQPPPAPPSNFTEVIYNLSIIVFLPLQRKFLRHFLFLAIYALNISLRL